MHNPSMFSTLETAKAHQRDLAKLAGPRGESALRAALRRHRVKTAR